ncbi:hypothetical protein CkaCkLH20_06189 [Colletotrichum karsti]|uniref:Transmembrane protein n=1 Tax=Colletotrichum karsti TaxID=1095194 RepID=A0A9P6I966_9PEZI|nr:uncharacterized protein CkaCkLH20_06189 [Colletotrichum karsti]KAF9876246.1 hypothetical protein CkaCkLH20_06189 [Colletotrichum karsti]
MPTPTILYQSLKRKHHLVSLVVVVSLVLKVQIVLAPGLYSLAGISSMQQMDLEILDSFNPNMTTSSMDTRPWYLATALRDFNLRRPFGVTEDHAFQTFNTPNGPSRGTVSAPISVTVDGYFTDVKCLKLESWRSSKLVVTQDALTEEPTMRSGLYTVDLELTFQGCKGPISLKNQRIHWINHTGTNDPREWLGIWQVIDVGLEEQRPCPNLPQTNIQTLYYATRINSSSPDLVSMAAVLCTSASWISQVQLVDDGMNPVTSAVSGADKTLITTDFFQLMSKSPPEGIPNYYPGGWCPELSTDSVCGPVDAAIRLLSVRLGYPDYSDDLRQPPNDISLYSTDALYNLTMEIANLENRFNMTEHSMDREPPSNGLPPIEATVTDNGRYRLVQHPGITYALVAILSLVTLVNLWSLIGAASRRFLGKKLPATTSFKGLAPDGFNSMAAMGSLIRDSNVFRHLPEGSEVLPKEELYDRMSDLSLRMGWFYSREAKKRIYTIGVVGDDDFVFLASKNESVKEREEHGQENE